MNVSSFLLGGWSNLNIPLIVNNRRGVLKLPGLITEFRLNPFEKEYAILSALHAYGISPKPLFIGNLYDDRNTPFMIYEFIDGRVVGSLEEFSTNDWMLLKRSFAILSQTSVPSIPLFKNADAYLDFILDRISKVKLEFCSHNSILGLIDELEKQLKLIHLYAGDIEWRTGLMHGDLQESNIVFGKNKAVFLDFEFSAIGDPLFDVAYLYHQGLHSSTIDKSLLQQEDSFKRVNELVPLALVTVICWSIEHLAHYFNGLLEPNLMANKSPEYVLSYIKIKLRELKERLHSI